MAMGKPNPHPRRTLKGNWTIEMHEDITALYDCNLESEIIDAFAEEIAKDVDKQILEQITLNIQRKTIK